MIQRVLVVDDEKPLRDAWERALVRQGYMVLSAGSGEEALDVIQNELVDVAFLDLMLPGMNGIELCRAIKKLNPVTCCFAVTGHSSVFELADCRAAGFEDYFGKPAPLELLLKAAADAFERQRRWAAL